MNTAHLDEAQRRAVESTHRQIFCLAGPGSGKTTVLTQRITHIGRTTFATDKIAAITYTNAAARNIESRINGAMLGFAGTLHGFCLRMLRDYGSAAGYGPRLAVLDEESANELLASKAVTMGYKGTMASLLELKARGRPVKTLKGHFSMPFTPAQLTILAYMEELAESNLIDFDLILSEFLRVLKNHGLMFAAINERFDHLLVDEVQDSAAIDWEIYRALPITNKFLVGDPDQAIFGFRGGDVSLAMRFAKDPGTELITLELNYRCAPTVCAAANQLISHNPNRLEKNTVPAGVHPLGSVETFPVFRNEGEEVAAVVQNAIEDSQGMSVAILARTNVIAAPFRDALKAMGAQVEEEPRADLPPDWALARSLLEMLANPENDTLAFFYVSARFQFRDGASPVEARRRAHEIRVEARDTGKTINQLWFQFPSHVVDVAAVAGQYLDKEKLTAESRMLALELARNLPESATMLDLALEAARTDRPEKEAKREGIAVTTIHSFKGREADCVFLVGFEEEVIPGRRKDVDVEEERRLAFVGVTRARHSVRISCSCTRRAIWGSRPIEHRNPSRFISEMIVQPNSQGCAL